MNKKKKSGYINIYENTEKHADDCANNHVKNKMTPLRDPNNSSRNSKNEQKKAEKKIRKLQIEQRGQQKSTHRVKARKRRCIKPRKETSELSLIGTTAEINNTNQGRQRHAHDMAA